MRVEHPAMKIPEFLVFARVFCVGLAAAEACRLSYYIGSSFAPYLVYISFRLQIVGIFIGLLICLIYLIGRGAYSTAIRLGRSLRLDLLITVLLGVWSNILISPWLIRFHGIVKHLVNDANPWLAPTLLFALLLPLVSTLCRTYWPRKRVYHPQLYFLTDEEIEAKHEDILKYDDQAKVFAKTVLASRAHSGLVFGIDGPWGIGKTSFINLAEQYWKTEGADSVIIFRFEPLRYAADPDLAERFIRDLTSTIQRQVFAPEFSPAASRYTRMLKGKAELSFLGFKLSFEPSGETIDELLEDIDDVLKRIGRRVIVVVDDLDRLEAKMVNNVLFTIRRTFNLSQATYVLCYDTECLVKGTPDLDKAREFLEKFLTVKLSLFIDIQTLRSFLVKDWRHDERQFQSIPSEAMLKLSSVLSELAEILDNNLAAEYIPLIGDLRKIKRFINAALLMQIEKLDIGKTDFNRRDLVNLILLQVHYPGLFRRVYAEESEGRSGAFSVRRRRDTTSVKFCNDDNFRSVIKNSEPAAQFLLKQIFDVNVLKIEEIGDVDEGFLSSRACFNEEPSRNLEKYLQLIVRFTTPEPRQTFKFYQDAVDDVTHGGKPIASVFIKPEFDLRKGDLAHDQF